MEDHISSVPFINFGFTGRLGPFPATWTSAERRILKQQPCDEAAELSNLRASDVPGDPVNVQVVLAAPPPRGQFRAETVAAWDLFLASVAEALAEEYRGSPPARPSARPSPPPAE